MTLIKMYKSLILSIYTYFDQLCLWILVYNGQFIDYIIWIKYVSYDAVYFIKILNALL